jgi:hypothetical protein
MPGAILHEEFVVCTFGFLLNDISLPHSERSEESRICGCLLSRLVFRNRVADPSQFPATNPHKLK